MKVAAIIPAAGVGTRMKSPSPKQFLTLAGSPILIHTLRKFVNSKIFQKLVVPLRKADMPSFQAILDHEQLGEVELVAGGHHRQDSVYNGFRRLESDTDIVVVHDGVRPFVDAGLVKSVVAEAAGSGAAILALPCVDTVKQVERSLVTATLPREKLVLVQTPQAFRYNLLQEGFEHAYADHYYATDESCLVERLGHAVTVIRGSERNIKITQPSDLPLAEMYIQSESNAR